MTSPDQHVLRVGEAERALTARLVAWSVPDPEDKARAFIRDLLRQGWSPHRPVTAIPPRPRELADPDRIHAMADEVREQMRHLRAARPPSTETSPEGAA
jgi:hypothetical protein